MHAIVTHMTWKTDTAKPDSANIPPIKCLFSWGQDLIGFSLPQGWTTFSQQHSFPQTWLGGGLPLSPDIQVSDLFQCLKAAKFHSHPVCVLSSTVNKFIPCTLQKTKCQATTVALTVENTQDTNHLFPDSYPPHHSKANPTSYISLWSWFPWFTWASQAPAPSTLCILNYISISGPFHFGDSVDQVFLQLEYAHYLVQAAETNTIGWKAYKQQKCISHGSEAWGARNPGSCRFSIWRGPAS